MNPSPETVKDASPYGLSAQGGKNGRCGGKCIGDVVEIGYRNPFSSHLIPHNLRATAVFKDRLGKRCYRWQRNENGNSCMIPSAQSVTVARFSVVYMSL